MTYAVYIVVVEDTNENAELLGLNAGTIESIMDIETEEKAIQIAEDLRDYARRELAD